MELSVALRKLVEWPSRGLEEAGRMRRSWSNDEFEYVDLWFGWLVRMLCLSVRTGLGIRNLKTWNKALMTLHIWKILTFKESLWLKWIHSYHLENKQMGTKQNFRSVKSEAWESLRVRDNKVALVIWFTNNKHWHALVSLLLIRRSLKTQDRLKSWDVFCATRPDSHDRIFFQCGYPTEVWNKMSRLTNLKRKLALMVLIVKVLRQSAKKSSITGLIGRLVFCASVYFLWQERNNQVFKKGSRNCDQLFQTIYNTERLKLFSLQIKK